MKKYKHFFEGGQSLVEIVFTLGFLASLIAGFVSLMVLNSKTARYSKNKATATRLGERLIEQAKTQKQVAAYWINIANFCQTGCVSSFKPTALSFGSEGSILYSVYYGYYETAGEKKKVRMKVVSWWDAVAEPQGTTQNKVTVETELSNWEQ